MNLAAAPHSVRAAAPHATRVLRRSRRFLLRAGLAGALLLECTTVRAQLTPNEQSARVMQLDRFVLPEFPPFLRQAGVLQGTVVAAIGRAPSGRADDVLVLESTDPRFTDATLEAVREWRFRPLDLKTATADEAVPVVRFLFTTGAVSVVPLTAAGRTGARRSIRADTPVELPNFSHLDQTPALLHHPSPEFPATLRGRVTQGIVVVKYFIDPTGRVRLPVVVSATETELGTAALTAMKQWRYDPPRIDGKPVIALERHSFSFNVSAPP